MRIRLPKRGPGREVAASMQVWAAPLPGHNIVPRHISARLVERIICAATAWTHGVLMPSAVTCERRPARRPCGGKLMLLLSDVPAQIAWMCPDCEAAGVVGNWRRSPWAWPRQEVDLDGDEWIGTVPFSVAIGLYGELLQVSAPSPTARRALDAATSLRPGFVEVEMGPSALECLITCVADARANVPLKSARHRRLNVLFDVLEAALVESN